MKKIKKYNVHLLFIILSILGIWLIQANGEPVMKTTLNGLDAAFHFSRIQSLADIFQSPVNFEYFNHIGGIANLFYPWLTVYPMYLLYALTGNIVLSFYIYFMIMTWMGLEITYYCALKMKVKPMPAVITAVIYMFSLCRISNIYYRVAIGEAVAMTFLPLVVYGCYALFYKEKPQWLPLMFGMTLITYTHVISLILATTLVLCFMVIALIQKRWTKQVWWALVKATLVTLLLASAFLVPMMEMMTAIPISSPQIYQLFESAVKMQDLIAQSLNNDVGAVNTYGIVLFILLGWMIYQHKTCTGFFKPLLWLSGLFTIMATQLFPWQFFQSIFMFIQFPWRFIALASLLISLLFGHYLSTKKISLKKASLIIGVVMMIHASTIEKVMLIDGREFGYNNKAIQTLITGTDGFNGDRDYIPKKGTGVFDTVKAQHVAVNRTWIVPKETSYNKNNAKYHIVANKKGYGALPIYYYKGMTLKHNNKVINCKQDENGLVYIPVNKGNNSYQLTVSYTPIARLAQGISFISFLGLIVFVLVKRKRI